MLRPTNPSACFFPAGSRLSSSATWGLTYSTLDSKLDPHEGWYVRFSQDIAGIGGDARYLRSTADARLYTPLFDGSDMVGILRVAGGNITGLGQPVSTIDNFFKGGETIRGFAPLGYGPRYVGGGANIALGGKNYINGTAEVQFPFPAVPPDFGLRGAFFADAGVLWGADIPASCSGRLHRHASRRHGDPLLGRRLDHLAVALRPDPRRFRPGAHQEELRRDAVLPHRHHGALLI